MTNFLLLEYNMCADDKMLPEFKLNAGTYFLVIHYKKYGYIASCYLFFFFPMLLVSGFVKLAFAAVLAGIEVDLSVLIAYLQILYVFLKRLKDFCYFFIDLSGLFAQLL
jgi:hypothetical protein